MKANVLCRFCQQICQAKPSQPRVVLTKDWKIVQHPSGTPTPVHHYSTFEQFENSARHDCHLCLLFFDHIPFDVIAALRDPTLECGQIGIAYAANERVSTFDLMLWYPFSARKRITLHKHDRLYYETAPAPRTSPRSNCTNYRLDVIPSLSLDVPDLLKTGSGSG